MAKFVELFLSKKVADSNPGPGLFWMELCSLFLLHVLTNFELGGNKKLTDKAVE